MAKSNRLSLSRPVIGGRPQAVLTEQDDPRKPLLLVLHGGPGEPMTPFYDTLFSLSERFVVCLWEQRGAGMSYSKSLRPEELRVSQYVSDAVEVTKYLLNRFHRRRLVLMGFSWGSLVGLLAAARAPELYAACVGVGQIADQRKSEQGAYETALLRAKQAGDQKSAKTLVQIGPPPYEGPNAMKLLMKERAVLRKHSGAKQPKLSAYFKKVFSCPYYAFSDKLNFLRGMKAGAALFSEVLSIRVLDAAPKVDVPFFVIQGARDMQTLPHLAEELVTNIDAPKKGFFLLENAGHAPLEDDPAGFAKALDAIEGLYDPWTEG